MTIQAMCERIACFWNLVNPSKHVTAEQIFNYSPTGELFMIWEWYDEAKFFWEYMLNEHTC